MGRKTDEQPRLAMSITVAMDTRLKMDAASAELGQPLSRVCDAAMNYWLIHRKDMTTPAVAR